MSIPEGRSRCKAVWSWGNFFRTSAQSLAPNSVGLWGLCKSMDPGSLCTGAQTWFRKSPKLKLISSAFWSLSLHVERNATNTKLQKNNMTRVVVSSFTQTDENKQVQASRGFNSRGQEGPHTIFWNNENQSDFKKHTIKVRQNDSGNMIPPLHYFITCALPTKCKCTMIR